MPPPSSRPDAAWKLYQENSGREYHDHKRALRPEALEWVMALRAEKFQPYVKPDAVVFESGVGSGWNLGRLRCARRIGCDASTFLADRVKALGIEFASDPSAAPEALADVVICHHALEHMLEPAAALRQLARILKPAGKLILHVPWERERRYARYHANEPNHHLYNWNAQNLGNLATVCGYRIDHVRIRRYGYDRFAANLAARWHAGATGFRLIRSGLITLRPLREVELLASRAAS